MKNKNDKIHLIYLGITISVSSLLVILGSIHFLDVAIALKVRQILLSLHNLNKSTEKIPDFLLYIVCFGTVFMWALYFYRWREKCIDVKMQFLKLAGTVLPFAYLLKTFSQFTFGRTSVRHLLLTNKPPRFNWFHHFAGGCFPSGHMTVFTAFGIAIWFYYPKYRKQVLITLILLGFALIATEYHFLSDVIAGAYLGSLSTYFLWHAFKER